MGIVNLQKGRLLRRAQVVLLATTGTAINGYCLILKKGDCFTGKRLLAMTKRSVIARRGFRRSNLPPTLIDIRHVALFIRYRSLVYLLWMKNNISSI